MCQGWWTRSLSLSVLRVRTILARRRRIKQSIEITDFCDFFFFFAFDITVNRSGDEGVFVGLDDRRSEKRKSYALRRAGRGTGARWSWWAQVRDCVVTSGVRVVEGWGGGGYQSVPRSEKEIPPPPPTCRTVVAAADEVSGRRYRDRVVALQLRKAQYRRPNREVFNSSSSGCRPRSLRAVIPTTVWIVKRLWKPQ